ncbi:hypothetical protein DUT91_24375 [Phyllobacterium salinisoli]|uniref:Uncharacterized protein n=1 Tax=Phyllobacterium salinisoli TaxID=1899321 RepID=A0A368JYY4_9HYPH|nr:hypothetical protein [Phyllobacterium salinisoli]RCS21403.1 hypothetical protein DUT91_24375 [Phyllobacterium salinisoli]
MASLAWGNLRSGLVCVIVATVAALTTHIFVQGWTQDIIGPVMQGLVPPKDGYPRVVVVLAYVTALMPTGIVAFVYYWTADRLPIVSRPLRALTVAALLLALKGELLRQPIMNAITYAYVFAKAEVPMPIEAGLLLQADKWAANLMLAFCLVYLCPVREHRAATAGKEIRG